MPYYPMQNGLNMIGLPDGRQLQTAMPAAELQRYGVAQSQPNAGLGLGGGAMGGQALAQQQYQLGAAQMAGQQATPGIYAAQAQQAAPQPALGAQSQMLRQQQLASQASQPGPNGMQMGQVPAQPQAQAQSMFGAAMAADRQSAGQMQPGGQLQAQLQRPGQGFNAQAMGGQQAAFMGRAAQQPASQQNLPPAAARAMARARSGAGAAPAQLAAAGYDQQSQQAAGQQPAWMSNPNLMPQQRAALERARQAKLGQQPGQPGPQSLGGGAQQSAFMAQRGAQQTPQQPRSQQNAFMSRDQQAQSAGGAAQGAAEQARALQQAAPNNQLRRRL